MTRTDLSIFSASGAFVWLAATLIFHHYGDFSFQNGGVIYAASVTGAVAGLVALFMLFSMVRRIPLPQYRLGALAFGVPSMLLEVPVLLDFASWMQTLRPETAGPYAALLLAGCAVLFPTASLLQGAVTAKASA